MENGHSQSRKGHYKENEQDNSKDAVAIHSLSPPLMLKLVDSCIIPGTVLVKTIFLLCQFHILLHVVALPLAITQDSSHGTHEWVHRYVKRITLLAHFTQAC